MRVLLFIEPAWLSRYWLEAVPLLRSRGVDASFVTLRESGQLNEALRAQGIEVFALGAKRVLDYAASARRLARIVKDGSFDIVHASEPIPAAVSCGSKWFGTRHLRLYHRHHFVCPSSTRVFDSIANKFSDTMMAVSHAVERAAVNDGFSQNRISVAYNGITALRQVDEAEVQELRNRLAIPSHALVISQVGRLSEEKGQLTLLKAAELMASQLDRPLHIVFTGAGPLESLIRESARSIARIKIHLTGHQDDVAPWFAIADVNVMPSYTEAFGIAAAEAMASGKPLVASAVGGLQEVVEDEVSGLLVPPRDVDALTHAVLRVVRSTELATRLGHGGIARVEANFTAERMVDGWIDCYNWALGLSR